MKCVICGKEIEHSPWSDQQLCSGKCFDVKFWNETLDEDAIVIGGVCYHDGGAKSENTAWLGFGGRKFKIAMNDGHIIETNNLWSNGIVPENLNVPDNARFI